MRKLILAISLFALILTACGDDSSPDEPEPTATPAATVVPTLSPVLVDLQRDYERISESQAAILKIWEDLAANEQVQCGDYPTVLMPEDISSGADSVYASLVDLLRSAAIDTAHAIDLWQAECLNPRTIIPPDVINEGRLAARSAGDALREAQTQLGTIQER
jgi:hypothetical protein